LEISLRNLARFYQITEEDGLLTDVAECLNSTVEEVTQRFDEINNSSA
jgi:hypothetical protein